MATGLIAGIAVQNVSFPVDKNYRYLVPPPMADRVSVGSRVLVPFGRGTSLRQGVIIELQEGEPDKKLKSVAALLDEKPIVTKEMIRLGEYMREHTFCTLFDALKTMLPAGLNWKQMTEYSLAEGWNHGQQLTDAEQLAVSYLMRRKGAVKRPVLLAALQLPSNSDLPERMVKEGILDERQRASRNVGDSTVRMIRLADEIKREEDLEKFPEKLTKKQRDMALILLTQGPLSVKELCYFTGYTEAVVKSLLRKNVVVSYEKKAYRRPYEKYEKTDTAPIVLSEEQEKAYQELFSRFGTGRTALLYGVTGSGKTSVYIKLIDQALAQGKGAIVMVPEISLTPQTLKRFYARYGSLVAVFHSALSAGERLDEWTRVQEGTARIAVGTRSAVFAPVKDLGLLIMDEEQEGTYQSDMSPRYHARDIAKYRVAESKGLLVLASATPSLSSYAAAEAGKYDLMTLTQRYGTAYLPQVRIVDMRREMAAGNRTMISRELYSELERNLEEGHQSILLMNRRGYNTYAACNTCGEPVTCPNCSISLTYHRDSNRLLCHYCGYSVPFTSHCEKCGSESVRYSGKGTQHVEEELQEIFPKARILRLDADSTMQKYAFDEKLGAFRRGEYDIIIGTQMVAKGLDFENVSLVGVLSADSELFNDDYKSMERTFDLITQVVGRSGRGSAPGKAIIQTIAPETEVIRLAARQDYPAFYRREITMRRAMVYPPYCTIAAVKFRGKNEQRVRDGAFRFLDILRGELTGEGEFKDLHLIVLSPMPERILKVSGSYRYRLLIKCRNDQRFRSMLKKALKIFAADRSCSGISTVVEIDGN